MDRKVPYAEPPHFARPGPAPARAAAGRPGEAEDFVRQSVARQRERLAVAERELAGARHVRWGHPDGAFYLWLDCRELLGRRDGGALLDDDLALTHQLLMTKHVACVAGSAFRAPGFVRLSLTVDADLIAEAARRVKDFAERAT